MKPAPIALPVRLLCLGVLLGGCFGLALAASGAGTATATVVSPVSTATPLVQQLLDRFSPFILLPEPESAGAFRIPVMQPPGGGDGAGGGAGGQPGEGAAGLGGGAGGGAAPEGSGGVQTVRNPDGSVSISVTGGVGLAHAVTRSPDGQLHVDFN